MPNHALRRGVAIVVVIVTWGSAFAHHSLSAVFDTAQKVTLTGTLTGVDWRNPHTSFALEVSADRGTVTWTLDGAPTFFFRDRGISKERFQAAVGRTITVDIYRARDGQPRGALLQMTFPDGTSLMIVPNA